ncbi:TonB-dependent receptor domain-containing protein [Chitinivibrio alkaliphilus]|uniref:TonB-dependent receptor n=1 Tax=Chitinivibrio alkaliphilus ACht1 TaxID=1313304 RepID=U7DBS0_9BACT|nr:TonB-dependent receptor [Chitinivibrio alkaliphilus]ERP31850.1 TonB-dependent receptor [Chitinivibrio alkaliphilus ACht1]
MKTLPEQTRFVAADYPRELYSAGVEGTVLLQLLISEDGTVEEVSVDESLHPVLDSTAVSAAKQFRFEPARLNTGDIVAVQLQYAYHFSLDEVVADTEEVINFQGRLRERGTRRPMANALVVLENIRNTEDIAVPLEVYLRRIGEFHGQDFEAGRLITETDSEGRFSFASLPACSLSVRVVSGGYEEFRREEAISAGEELLVTYYIPARSYDDYEVVAYYRKEEREVSRRSLPAAEVQRVPGLSGDAVRVVQALPGVARLSFGSGNISVRGSYLWDSKFLLDGVEIPQLYHFGGLKSVVNSEAIEAVDFYPGGWGVRHGGAIGGLVDVQTRRARDDRFHGKVGASSLDAYFFVEGPLRDDLRIMASARRSYFGDIASAVLDNIEDGPDVSLTPFYWDYLASIEYAISPDHHVRTSLYGSYDSLEIHLREEEFSAGSDDMDHLDKIQNNSSFVRFTTALESRLFENLSNELTFSLLQQKTYNAAFGFFMQDLTVHGMDIQNTLSKTFSESVSLHVGTDVTLGSYDLYLDILGVHGVNRDTLTGDMNRIGGYVYAELRPRENWLVIPGIRYDHYGLLHHEGAWFPDFWEYSRRRRIPYSGEPSARISTRYSLSDAHVLKAAAGTYNQSPQPFGFVTHETWGNPDLPATKAAHYVVGHEWQITDRISTDIQGYYNMQWDIPRMQNSDDDFDRENINQNLFIADETGRTYGMELMLRHNRGERFFGWLAYTLSRSERWDVQKEEYRLFDQDQTHNLQLVGSFSLPNNWEVGGRMHYTTGNPDTPVSIGNENIQGKSIGRISGEENSIRKDPFFKVDLRAEKQWIFERTILTSHVDIQNISWFFHKNPEFTLWDDFYKERQDISMIPLIDAGFTLAF